MTAHGAFHWNSSMTRDVKQAKDFYGKALGWTYEDMPMQGDGMYGTYTMVYANGQMVGGMMEMKRPDVRGRPRPLVHPSRGRRHRWAREEAARTPAARSSANPGTSRASAVSPSSRFPAAPCRAG